MMNHQMKHGILSVKLLYKHNIVEKTFIDIFKSNNFQVDRYSLNDLKPTNSNKKYVVL